MFWSGTGSLVAITAEDSFYILRFDRDAYNTKLEEGAEITDEGVEEAFEVVADVPDGSVTVLKSCFFLTPRLPASKPPSG
jgi:coatomer subunit beta'